MPSICQHRVFDASQRLQVATAAMPSTADPSESLTLDVCDTLDVTLKLQLQLCALT